MAKSSGGARVGAGVPETAPMAGGSKLPYYPGRFQGFVDEAVKVFGRKGYGVVGKTITVDYQPSQIVITGPLGGSKSNMRMVWTSPIVGLPDYASLGSGSKIELFGRSGKVIETFVDPFSNLSGTSHLPGWLVARRRAMEG